MPFKSEAQRRFMFAKHPAIAKEFAAATPKGARLPEHVANKMAKGGKVDSDETWEDHGSHFMRTKGGRSMKIAKNKLSTRVVNQFQAMCTGGIAGMAYGGPVQKMAGGGFSTKIEDQAPEDFVAPGNPVVQDIPGAEGEGTPGTGHVPNPTFMDTMSEALQQTPMAAGMAMPATATPAPERQVTGKTAEVPPPQPNGNESAMGPGIGPAPSAPVRKVLEMSGEQKEAYKAGEAAAQQKADAESEGLRLQADAREAGAKVAKAAYDTHQNTLMDINKGLDQVREEYRNGKIDPEQYWKSKGTAGQIATGIGILLSGFGQGLSAAGGNKGIPNMALEMLNKKIEQNIDAQKTNLNAKGNEYKMWLDKLGNEQQAYAVTKAHNLEMLANQVQTIADRSGSKAVQANAAMTIAAIRKEQATISQGIAQARADATWQAGTMNWQQSVVDRRLQQAAQAKVDAAGLPKSISDRVTFNLEAGPKLLQQIEEAKKDAPGFGAGVGQRINNDLGGGSIAGDAWDTRVGLLVGEAAKLAKGGVPDQDEMKRLLAHAPSSNAPRAKKIAYLNFLEDYGKGLLKVDNEQFVRMGRKPPHDLSQWDKVKTK